MGIPGLFWNGHIRPMIKQKKKELKKVVQRKKEYGTPTKKEYKEEAPKKKAPPVSDPEDIVSVSFTRGDLFLIQKKFETSNPALAEYVQATLEVTEKAKQAIEAARNMNLNIQANAHQEEIKNATETR